MSVLVLALRAGSQSDDTIELLCLRAGDCSRFRLYLSTLDLDLIERGDDIDGVEFDTADDEGVRIFLIETMWYLHIEPRDLQWIDSTNLISGVETAPMQKSDANGVIDALFDLAEKQLNRFGNTRLAVFAVGVGVKIATTVEHFPSLTSQHVRRLDEVRSRCSALLTTLYPTSKSVLARQHQKP